MTTGSAQVPPKKEQIDEEDIQEVGHPIKQHGHPGASCKRGGRSPRRTAEQHLPLETNTFTSVDPDWVKTPVSLWPSVRHLKVQVLRLEKRKKKKGALSSEESKQTCGQSLFLCWWDKRMSFLFNLA